MSRHAARARSGQDRLGLYQEITDKIIAELEAGRAPWVQPWGTAAAKALLAMPKNAATHRCYSRINVLILWGAVIEHGFTGQSWLTFRQALSLGRHVRKGGGVSSHAGASSRDLMASPFASAVAISRRRASTNAARSTICAVANTTRGASFPSNRLSWRSLDRYDMIGFLCL
jgi:hypothetical protein